MCNKNKGYKMSVNVVSIPFISGQCVINHVKKELFKEVSIPFISGQCVIKTEEYNDCHFKFQSPLYRVNV